MKPTLLTLLGCMLFSIHSYSQSCVIKITYDANGNRILREQFCSSSIAPGDSLVPASEFKNLDSFASAMSGLVKVYPNPASDVIHVSFDALSSFQSGTVALYDQSGKELFRKVATTSLVTIPVTHLADGVYHVVLSRGIKKHTVNVVKKSGGYRR